VFGEIDPDVEIVPRDVDRVVDRADERREPDRDPERAVAWLEEIDGIALRDDPDDALVVDDREPVERRASQPGEDVAHVLVRSHRLHVGRHAVTSTKAHGWRQTAGGANCSGA
jgi:hypothetical protein